MKQLCKPWTRKEAMILKITEHKVAGSLLAWGAAYVKSQQVQQWWVSGVENIKVVHNYKFKMTWLNGLRRLQDTPFETLYYWIK